MGTNGKPSATAIIGKSEALDLSALLSSNQANGANGRSISASPALDARMVSILRSAGIRLDQQSVVDAIRVALQKSSTITANKLTTPTTTANPLISLPIRKPRSSLGWSERLCFSGDYIFFNEGKPVKRDYAEQAIQYKCTFPGCQKRLASNVNFMYHVIAHAKNARSRLMSNLSNVATSLTFGVSEQIIGEREQQLRAETCFECLAEFTTMRQLYNHIFYVHRSRGRPAASRPVCFICEKIVPIVDAEKHAEMHGDQALPFHCPACRWRTSSRNALLCHFEEFHDANSLLFCPFCLLKFPVKRPSSVKGTKRGVVVVPHFVDHCLDHFRDKTKKHGCEKCSVKFSAQRIDDLRANIEEHKRMGHEKTVKLKIERRTLSDLFNSNTNQRIAYGNCLPSTCFDCGHLVTSFNSHYRKMIACKNQNCQFETRCIKAQQQHEMVCPFLETSRIPYGWKSLVNIKINSFNKEPLLLECNMCLFKTFNACAFNEHLRKCIGTKPKFANRLSHYQKSKRLRVDEDQSIDEADEISVQTNDSNDLDRLESFMFLDSTHVAREKQMKSLDETMELETKRNPTIGDEIFVLTARLGSELKDKDPANSIASKLFPFGRLSHRRN